jgi:predicted dienelactone hydrolase
MAPSHPSYLFAMTALALLLGCDAGGDEPPVDPLAWSVEESGPYAVGYTTWELTYTPAGSSAERTLLVHLWYPTDDTSGEGVTYEFMFGDDDSWLDAAPAQAVHPGGYPVHAYSHGYLGFAGSSSFLMRTFASHGWVGVAPDHLGNTLSTNIDPLPLSMRLDRSQDISAALDSLVQQAAQLLGGPVDEASSVLSGHSFGGYTTWPSMGAAFDRARIEDRCEDGAYPAEQCTDELLDAFEAGASDPRFAAGIPMAGGGGEDWFGEDGLRAVQRPMLQLSGSLDASAVDGIWERTEGVDLTWVDVEGGCHQLFALGSCDEVPTDEGYWLVSSYALAFARHHALGDDSDDTLSLLDGSRLLSDRITLQRR